MSTTEPEPRHLHLHLGAIGPGETHIHVHVDTPNGAAAPEITVQEATVQSTTEASLARLKAWDPANADHIQAAHDGLVQLGCVPHPAASRKPQPGAYIQPYLRWTHPRHPGGSVGYLNAATFSFAGKNDLPRVADMPGADNRGSAVYFPIGSREGVRQALAAVRHLVGGS
jgi:hypothetical protein